MPIHVGKELAGLRRSVDAGDGSAEYFSIAAAEEAGLGALQRLPFVLKVVLENLLRHADGETTTVDDVRAFEGWLNNGGRSDREIAFRPARVLMQDFTGVPAIVDLAAMRDGLKELGGKASAINPRIPVDLVIDHSVSIDAFGNAQAFAANVEREYERNGERYAFLKWGQRAFDNFRVVPPGTGICHQVNLEFLAQVVCRDDDQDGRPVLFSDTLVGTDSHTTMINGVSVLGWGVGGIEAEAAMLGQPISMLLPEVVGFRLSGAMPEGTTATDLVLKVVQMLRAHGVVGKFVEFFGDGLDAVPLADRATIANMAPEYGANCGFFPIDDETLDYLRATGRDDALIARVDAYARAQGLWRESGAEPVYTDTLELDMSELVPAIAGPKRPQDHVALSDAATTFHAFVSGERDNVLASDVAEARWEGEGGPPPPTEIPGDVGHHRRGHVSIENAAGEQETVQLNDGSIVIASITSCTNTSNPSVMIGAGLLARKARELGMQRKPWVKTSLAPGSKVVSAYLEAAGLQDDLDALGFNLVGYGCTTCIGNSGPLHPAISQTIQDNDLIGVSVLSGNRNFEGRISPDVRANFLASPPLVVAYALAGDINVDISREPLGVSRDGTPVYLKDLWPDRSEIDEVIKATVTREAFREKYADVFTGDERWKAIDTVDSETYDWPEDSTYVRKPPFFEGMSPEAGDLSDIEGARILALLGDMVTTDHISPAGAFSEDSPAGRFLREKGVEKRDFNSYGSRRGNHEVMMRGTLANIRLRNEMLDGVEGGYTLGPDGEQVPIYEAAMAWGERGVPLVVIAGQQYGAGSSRDWAAKGKALLGVRAVIAESFERIHRSNLIGMGVVPLEFTDGASRKSLALRGTESVSIHGLGSLKAGSTVNATVGYEDGSTREISLRCRVDTAMELDYLRHGGVLRYVLRGRVADAA